MEVEFTYGFLSCEKRVRCIIRNTAISPHFPQVANPLPRNPWIGFFPYSFAPSRSFYKCNDRVYKLLCMPSFTEHNANDIHPSWCWVVFHCTMHEKVSVHSRSISFFKLFLSWNTDLQSIITNYLNERFERECREVCNLHPDFPNG